MCIILIYTFDDSKIGQTSVSIISYSQVHKIFNSLALKKFWVMNKPKSHCQKLHASISYSNMHRIEKYSFLTKFSEF